MSYQLAPGLHFASVGGEGVLLDVPSDRYRMLGARLAAALEHILSGEGPDDDAAVTTLADRGILLSGDARACKPLASPTTSSLEQTQTPAHEEHWPAVGIALVRAAFDLRLGLQVALARLERRSRATIFGEERADDVVSLAQSWSLLRARIPIRQICLRDAVALTHWLAGRGHLVHFVVGVRLDPFGAHSWVQTGTTVLGDDRDTVNQFAPILVL